MVRGKSPLQTPEDLGSNPVIGNFYNEHFWLILEKIFVLKSDRTEQNL